MRYPDGAVVLCHRHTLFGFHLFVRGLGFLSDGNDCSR